MSLLAEREIVAEGVWCRDCEFFEVPDMDGGRCLACGCDEGRHIDVEVVAIS